MKLSTAYIIWDRVDTYLPHLVMLDEQAAAEWVARENRIAKEDRFCFTKSDMDPTTYPEPHVGDVSTH